MKNLYVHTQGTYGDWLPVPTSNKDISGGKGAGLLEMTNMGLPVPEALILTTGAWLHYRKNGVLSEDTLGAIETFVYDEFPESMFSVRSGAPVSMPGMMDTILNVGVGPDEDKLYPACFSRFVKSWLTIVHKVDYERADSLVDVAEHYGVVNLKNPRELILSVLDKAPGNLNVPVNRLEQAVSCVRAVFDSWDTPRAKAYRAMHNIPDDMGTACILQRMVMGTATGLSGSGVMFTRNPATGEPVMKGEIAFNAQGEEVVSGAITPQSMDELENSNHGGWAKLHDELGHMCGKLELAYNDVQDIEFTVEKGYLYLLQTRTAKMSARARIVTACSFASNMEAKPALEYLRERVTRGTVALTCTPTVNTTDEPDATGLAASPGAISGRIVFRSTPLAQIDKNCILVAEDTSPDDFPQMSRAGAILTTTGGFTCHSAVVARGIGVPAVVGCEALSVDNANKLIQIVVPDGSLSIMNKDGTITIDGAKGAVYLDQHEVTVASPPRELYEMLHKAVIATHTLPYAVYYKDCSVGDYVALSLNPADMSDCERQIIRAGKYVEQGKTVGFFLDLPGFGEDLIYNNVEMIFMELVENFAPDLAGHSLLGGMPWVLLEPIAQKLGMKVTGEAIAYIDLLDLLD